MMNQHNDEMIVSSRTRPSLGELENTDRNKKKPNGKKWHKADRGKTWEKNRGEASPESWPENWPENRQEGDLTEAHLYETDWEDADPNVNPKEAEAQEKASMRNLLCLACIGSLLLMGESLFLRSGLHRSFFSTFSTFDMAWYALTLFLVALCFSLLMPKKLQLLVFSIQLSLNILILGAILSFQELPTLGLLHLIFTLPGLAGQTIRQAIGSPFVAVPFILFVFKVITVFFMPPFRAKQRLPWGALLFMACCITLIPSQSATLGVFTTTRSPTYKIMATQSIQRHGYFFTWLAEQQSNTWRDCYIPPAKTLK